MRDWGDNVVMTESIEDAAEGVKRAITSGMRIKATWFAKPIIVWYK